MNHRNAKRWYGFLLAIGFSCAVLAAEPDSNDTVIAQNATVKLTRIEFEAEIERIPPEMRVEFLMSNKRVGDLLTQLLLRKTLATQAKAEKLDAKPLSAARINGEVDRVLAEMRVAAVDEAASASFEAKRAAQVARAREMYTVDRDRYRTPEEISASHILFTTKKHSSEEAQKLAAEARARIVAGADFNAVAKELSEDPSARTNSGSLGWFTRDKMDGAFANAAFALKNTGDISQPVQSSFGWHLIRLEGRHAARAKSFEEVQDDIVASLKKTYVDQQRNALLNGIRSDPSTEINDAEVAKMLDRLKTPPTAPHAPHAPTTAPPAPKAAS